MFGCTCQRQSSIDDNINNEVVCKSITFIKKYLEGKTVDGMELEKYTTNLEEITGIKSRLDGSPFCLKNPSQKNLDDWKNWLESNCIKCRE